LPKGDKVTYKKTPGLTRLEICDLSPDVFRLITEKIRSTSEIGPIGVVKIEPTVAKGSFTAYFRPEAADLMEGWLNEFGVTLDTSP
jgi:hypothetical protein